MFCWRVADFVDYFVYLPFGACRAFWLLYWWCGHEYSGIVWRDYSDWAALWWIGVEVDDFNRLSCETGLCTVGLPMSMIVVSNAVLLLRACSVPGLLRLISFWNRLFLFAFVLSVGLFFFGVGCAGLVREFLDGLMVLVSVVVFVGCCCLSSRVFPVAMSVLWWLMMMASFVAFAWPASFLLTEIVFILGLYYFCVLFCMLQIALTLV